MGKKHGNRTLTRAVVTLLEHGTTVTGLRLAFHDILQRASLPAPWMLHTVPFCDRIKKNHLRDCSLHCSSHLGRILPGLPQGLIEQCPFGGTQICVPVFSAGMFAGVLFAGMVWHGTGRSPEPDLPAVPSMRWLEERRTVIRAIARELGELLQGEDSYRPADRRATILRLLQERRESGLTLAELAQALRLSPSRAGHVVRELLGCTFPEALRRQRLQAAAHLLATSDLPVGEIARLTGFDDPNYFSRQFARSFSLPPRAYRQRYHAGV